ncbi:hypothetical protein ACRAWF_01475 [Streptomyces sp. L7]
MRGTGRSTRSRDWLEAHRHLWSPNTVRGYATSLAQWWTFLEQRDEAGKWRDLGVPAVAGFLPWLRNGRRVEHALVEHEEAPAPETLEARLAALISFYRWQEAVFSVPVASRIMRGAPRRAPARGLLAHLDARTVPGPSSLVRVRRHRHQGRPRCCCRGDRNLNGCAMPDASAGEWAGGTCVTGCCSRCSRRAGCAWVEALGLRIGDFVMGRGSTPYIEIVPREGNPNGARVRMMRPRRVYVGTDLERLFADYLTHLACRAAELGIEIRTDSPLLVNLTRPPLLAALRKERCGTRPPPCARRTSDPSPGPRTGSGILTRPRC